MKIALIGYGKMGKMIEQIALTQGHTIAVIVDPFITKDREGILFSSIERAALKPLPEAGSCIESTMPREGSLLDSADVAIEFTQPSTAAANIISLMHRKIPTVTGTTGWFNSLDEVSNAVKAAESSLLWASNFSIGVNLFYRIAWYAAELANNFSEYDIGGFEAHHNKKLDSPSGTAKVLAEGVLSRIDRKNKIVWEALDRKPEADEIHFPSLRMGSIPGQHSLFFDSPADTIEITHTARSREGFACGALRAAEWLVAPSMAAEKRRGVFTIDQMLKDILKI